MLKLENVSKYYRSETTVNQALRRISVEFHQNEFVVITGESGSGKSTLLNVLSGLDTYEEGELYVAGEETSYYAKEDWEHYRSQYIGFIFQNYNIIDAYTVYQNVMAALIIQGYNKANRSKRAKTLIEQVGLTKQMHQKSSTLSGGQKQRVSIARALAKDAPIIVADEPTGNLDKETGENIIKLLKEISNDKLVIMVTHNYEAVQDDATRHVRLFDGEIVEDKVHQKTDIGEIKAAPYHRGMPFNESIKMALRNLLSMPKRLVLMLMIGLFIVLAFSLVYGSRVAEDSMIRTYGYHPMFTNAHQSRLVLARWDGEPFTESEIDAFSALSRVKGIVPFDPLFDMELYMETPQGYRDVVRIVPAIILTERQLDSGRMPTNQYEIIAPQETWHRTYQLGDTISASVFPGYEYGHELSDSETITYTVVGLYDNPSWYFYMHDDFYQDTYNQSLAIQTRTESIIDYDGSTAIGVYEYRIDDSLEDNQIRISQGFVQIFGGESDDYLGMSLRVTLDHAMVPSDTHDYEIVGVSQTGSYRATIYLNEAQFTTLFAISSTQISLIVEDIYDAERVMSGLDDETYLMIYPASYVDPYMLNIGIATRVLSMILMIVLMIALYFITYVTFKNIMTARKKDYIIFRSIGAAKKDLYRITIIELIVIFLLAFSLVYLFLVVNRTVLYWIPDYLRFYTLGNYVFVIVLLIVLASFVGYRFNVKIFKDSVISALRVE